jgi:hypothetical protein
MAITSANGLPLSCTRSRVPCPVSNSIRHRRGTAVMGVGSSTKAVGWWASHPSAANGIRDFGRAAMTGPAGFDRRVDVVCVFDFGRANRDVVAGAAE